MKQPFFQKYWNHTALNAGQACRDLRYFYYHPDADKKAQAGTLKHYLYSFRRRLQSLGNNALYADPLLAGFVFPDDNSKARQKIFDAKKLVGFATPRKDHDGVWRMGAIYVAPEFRNRGLAQKTISEFMKGKKGRAFIEDDNLPCQRAYQASGFQVKRAETKTQGSWWENF